MSTMPSAARVFAPDHPVLPLTAKKRIEVERNKRVQDLGEGFAENFEDYKHRAGVIEGLRIALGIVEDIEKELHEDRGR